MHISSKFICILHRKERSLRNVFSITLTSSYLQLMRGMAMKVIHKYIKCTHKSNFSFRQFSYRISLKIIFIIQYTDRQLIEVVLQTSF